MKILSFTELLSRLQREEFSKSLHGIFRPRMVKFDILFRRGGLMKNP